MNFCSALLALACAAGTVKAHDTLSQFSLPNTPSHHAKEDPHHHHHHRRHVLRTVLDDHHRHLDHDQHEHHHHHHHDDAMCGFREPSREDEMVEQARLEGLQQALHQQRGRQRRTQVDDAHCRQCISIDMYFHLILADVGFGSFIPHPQEAVDRLNEGDSTLVLEDFSTKEEIIDMIRANADVVNKAFADTPFQFNFVVDAVTETTNTTWTVYAGDFVEEASELLGQGDLRKMDVFLNFRLQERENDGTTSGTGTLGFAILPFAQLAGRGDGVFLRYDVLSGGGREGWNFGYAFVHEIGHWLGLYHTFQTSEPDNTCSPTDTNDFIADTPAQSGPTSTIADDCTIYLDEDVDPLDSCPDLEGKDPIFNYLNYLDNDYCWEMKGEFTPGQVDRMHRHWRLYRDHKTKCEDPDNSMEVEVVVTFDLDHANENQIILEDSEGSIIFDSVRDHRGAIAFFVQQTLFFDICVPDTSALTLTVLDSEGDGFTNGKIHVYRNGSLLQVVQGDGFRRQKILIPPANIPFAVTVPAAIEELADARLRGNVR